MLFNNTMVRKVNVTTVAVTHVMVICSINSVLIRLHLKV